MGTLMAKYLRLAASGLALLFLFAGRLPAATIRPATDKTVASTQEEALRPREDIKGLKNFAKVSDILYRGAQPTKEGFAELKKLGIKTVINLRAKHSDEELIKGLDLNYLAHGMKVWV
jgi:protein tyrosine/serine phosphatase